MGIEGGACLMIDRIYVGWVGGCHFSQFLGGAPSRTDQGVVCSKYGSVNVAFCGCC